MALNLENTEIAFQSRSDIALRRSYWLFKLMGMASLVSLGAKLVRLCLKLRLPIEGLIRKTAFLQFCGGETIAQCEGTIFDLASYRIGTILDYSVEGSEKERELDATAKEILRTIELAQGNPRIPFCVFKLTGITRFHLLEEVNAGEKLSASETKEWERARHRLRALCLNCHQKQVRVFIDAEESWIQGTVDSLAEEMMREFNRERAIVFHTVQMYRNDRLDYLKRLHATAIQGRFFLGVKVVRGAYMEKERERATRLGRPSPIFPDKTATDRHYDEALKFCLNNLGALSLCAGTHNERSTLYLTELMKEKGMAPGDTRVFFSQLLGMSDHLSYNLAAAGYNVAKYVPFGPVRAMVPYLIRRAEENTSVLGQTSRELSLISTERTRRRRQPRLQPQSPSP